MARRVRLKDIAEAAGVSVSTVSRALRGDERVAIETRRIVEIEARRLNYPYLPGGADASRSTATAYADALHPIPGLKRLSVILRENLQKHFFAETLLEIIEQGRRRSFEVHYEVCTDPLPLCLSRTSADAVVFILWEPISVEDADALRNHSKPVLVINRYLEGMVNSITLDDYAAGMQSARYLWELGHRRIAYIPGRRSASSFRDREAGFRAALEEYGIFDPELLAAPADRDIFEAIRLSVLQFLDHPNPPTAIATFNDLSAYRALITIRDLGFKVPEDISVLGFDHVPEFRSYGITTWDYRRKDLGLYTIHLLEALCTGHIEGPFRMAIAPLLVEGTTTGRAPGVVDKASQAGGEAVFKGRSRTSVL